MRKEEDKSKRRTSAQKLPAACQRKSFLAQRLVVSGEGRLAQERVRCGGSPWERSRRGRREWSGDAWGGEEGRARRKRRRREREKEEEEKRGERDEEEEEEREAEKEEEE